MTYRSRVDFWLILTLLACYGYVLVLLFSQSDSLDTAFLMICISVTAASLIFIYRSFWPCKYMLKEDYLHITCGTVIDKKVKYSDIKSVAKSYSFLSAPALSLSRLRIDHDGGVVLISPVNREEFMEALKNRILRFSVSQ